MAHGPTYRLVRALRNAISPLGRRVAPVSWKRLNERAYWHLVRRRGDLTNAHYERAFTEHFDLDRSFYRDKVIVDIGCGPRGSLEWATMARRRIGVDPLAHAYRSLGADHHAMEYLAVPSEAIPLPSASCDVVSSFNSLDHVEDVPRTLHEIARLTRPGGLFLLLVEVNHAPTNTEPHRLTVEGLTRLIANAGFKLDRQAIYRLHPAGLYASLRADDQWDETTLEPPGFLSARFTRR